MGVYVTTPKVSKTEAKIALEIDVDKENALNCTINTIIKDQNNCEVARVETNLSAVKNGVNYQDAIIKKPLLWSLKNPHQYVAITELKLNDNVVDRVETNFGIISYLFGYQVVN